MSDAVMNAIENRRKLIELESRLAAPAQISQWREQQFWFDNLIQNGTFDVNTTGWTISSADTMSVVSGRMRVENTDGDDKYNSATQIIQVDQGRDFVLNVNGWDGTGAASVILTQQSGGSVDDVAIYTDGQLVTIPARAEGVEFTVFLRNNSTTGDTYSEFDNATLFETDGTDIIHRLPDGWIPHHVYVDGLLQREGAGHDYTVETDGFDTWIKPAVAPGAVTETCIMGVRKV